MCSAKTIRVSGAFLCAVVVLFSLDRTYAFAPHCLGRCSSLDARETKRFYPTMNLPSASFSSSRLAMVDSSVDSDQPKNDIPEGTASGLDSVEDRGFLRKLRKTLFGGSKKMNKQSLAKMGRSMALSYGFVSNASGSIVCGVAWFIASKKSGLSPLAPGQWKGFLAVYAGFYALLNVIRPARFAVAAAVSKYFEGMINTVKRRLKCSSAMATFWVVLIVNFCGSLAMYATAIVAAGVLAGVPVWVGR